MPDDRDWQKPKTSPVGIPILDAPTDDDLTPGNAPSHVLIGKISERVKEMGTNLTNFGEALEASVARDETAHAALNTGLGDTNARLDSLNLTVAKMDGKLDILVGDRTHEQKIEQIAAIAETKLIVVKTKAELDDINNKKAVRRKLWMSIVKLFASIITVIAGGMLGAGLHGC